MIHFFLGTKAQLIKTAPVMAELSKRDIRYRFIDTGQHAEFTTEIRSDFGVPEPDFSLSGKTEDVATYGKAASWIGTSVFRWASRPGWIRETVFGGEQGICVVHGDTVSTLIGTQFARRIGVDVAHLEAGLRSFSFFDPFPEELIRVHCMKRSRVLFAPDDLAEKNLDAMRVKGTIVPTHGNTIIDAIRLATSKDVAEDADPYVLATFHRLETLRSSRRLRFMIDALNFAARSINVKFVMHKPTERALTNAVFFVDSTTELKDFRCNLTFALSS